MINHSTGFLILYLADTLILELTFLIFQTRGHFFQYQPLKSDLRARLLTGCMSEPENYRSPKRHSDFKSVAIPGSAVYVGFAAAGAVKNSPLIVGATSSASVPVSVPASLCSSTPVLLSAPTNLQLSRSAPMAVESFRPLLPPAVEDTPAPVQSAFQKRPNSLDLTPKRKTEKRGSLWMILKPSS